MAEKIATCCYCGARSLLRLRGAVQHELSCGSCGAPIRQMKQMPARPMARPAPKPSPAKPAPERRQRRKNLRKKSPIRGVARLIDDLWDEIEDIFD